MGDRMANVEMLASTDWIRYESTSLVTQAGRLDASRVRDIQAHDSRSYVICPRQKVGTLPRFRHAGAICTFESYSEGPQVHADADVMFCGMSRAFDIDHGGVSAQSWTGAPARTTLECRIQCAQ
jgi:hypothetical protein